MPRRRLPTDRETDPTGYELLPVSVDMPEAQIRIRQFLNRWTWRCPMTVCEAELMALVRWVAVEVRRRDQGRRPGPPGPRADPD